MIYSMPIWDVFACEGERERAGKPFNGAILLFFFPIRQAVPVGFARLVLLAAGHIGSIS